MSKLVFGSFLALALMAGYAQAHPRMTVTIYVHGNPPTEYSYEIPAANGQRYSRESREEYSYAPPVEYRQPRYYSAPPRQSAFSGSPCPMGICPTGDCPMSQQMYVRPAAFMPYAR